MAASWILGASVVEAEIHVDVRHRPDDSGFVKGKETRLGHFAGFAEFKIPVALGFPFVEAWHRSLA